MIVLGLNFTGSLFSRTAGESEGTLNALILADTHLLGKNN